MKPETSILLPTYNNGPFLMECIGSILRQQYTNYEIVVIDDHSLDHTAEIIFNLLKIDERIKYYKNREGTQGLVSALNYGISLCQGEYIARMDADDIMIGNRLSEQINYLKENPEIHAVCSGMQLIDESGLPMKQSRGTACVQKSKLLHLFMNMYTHATMTLKKEILTKYKYRKSYVYCEDYDLWSRIIRNFNIKHLNDIHHIYRIYKKSNTSNYSKENSVQAILSIFSNQLNYYSIPHNEWELIIHYGLYYRKEQIGSKEEIHSWLDKIFKSKKINEIFSVQLIEEVREQLYRKVELKSTSTYLPPA